MADKKEHVLVVGPEGGCAEVWSSQVMWGQERSLFWIKPAWKTSVVHAATRGHVDVLDLCCRCLLWPRKLLLRWCLWLQTHNWEWETSKASVTISTPHTPKETTQTGIYWRETLNIVIKMLKCSSSQLMLLVGRIQLSLRVWPLGIWSRSREYVGNTN